MQRTSYLERIGTLFRTHPIVGLLGPRQCGKTTLAREYIHLAGGESVHYFDLEDPDDLGPADGSKARAGRTRRLGRR